MSDLRQLPIIDKLIDDIEINDENINALKSHLYELIDKIDQRRECLSIIDKINKTTEELDNKMKKLNEKTNETLNVYNKSIGLNNNFKTINNKLDLLYKTKRDLIEIIDNCNKYNVKIY